MSQPSQDVPTEAAPPCDALDAGLAIAFGSASGLLEALRKRLTEVPRIRLREPEDATEPIGDPIAGRYHVHAEIARGGMGAILEGRDTEIGRTLAVKVLLETYQNNPEIVRRFLEEAQIAGQLQHPGIVPVYDVGQLDDARPYFTMKLVRGRTLAELLTEQSVGPVSNVPGATEARYKRAPQDLSRFLDVFAQVCNAVAYAHSRGVIHRDLKPANVMVGMFGEVQVMDWGLAKVLDQTSRGGQSPEEDAFRTSTPVPPGATPPGSPANAPSSPAQTQAGVVLGTPPYMPPEQARGEVEQLDERADVFGLGAILCEILTGQPPYIGSARSDLLAQAREGGLTDAFCRLDNCGADADLVALAKKCLAPRREDRPADAVAVARALSDYRSGVQERLRQAELERAAAQARAEEERKRRRLVLALAGSVLALVMLGGGGGLWLMRDRQLRRERAMQAVTDALAEATQLRGQGRVGEALLVARRADALISESEVPHQRVRELIEELDQMERDQELIKSLEEARLRQTEVNVRASRFDSQAALPAYGRAFANYGLVPRLTPVPDAAARIQAQSAALQQTMITALDEWLWIARPDRPETGWLDALLRSVDSDPWRAGLRRAMAKKDRLALEKLAADPGAGNQPAETLALLGNSLTWDHGAYKAAERVLRQAQRRYPGDFWINVSLGRCLSMRQPPAHDEALRFYTAALSVLPENAGVLLNYSYGLMHKGNLEEALATLDRLIRLRPDYAEAHNNRGSVLLKLNRKDEAIEAFRKALTIKPKCLAAQINLRSALGQDTEIDRYIGRLNDDPDQPSTWVRLGLSAHQSGRHDLAVKAYRQALEIDRDNVEAHYQLSQSLLRLGDLAGAEEALRRADTLKAKQPGLSPVIGYWLNFCRQARRLEPHLDDVFSGKRKLAGDPELAVAAQLCYVKGRFADSVRLYRLLFTRQPGVADNLDGGVRYSAACTAARAGGADFRQQALTWLKADLAGWQTRLEKGEPQTDKTLAEWLGKWQREADLAGVRDESALAKLPAAERSAWQELWAEVAKVKEQAGKKAG
jgi:serine/threonine-protein kinase